jgi:superfamily II DNA or RNA helicase
MNSYPSDITFKYPWRSYQQKVLQELEEHLKDNRLHVIAPPGSGKTVLGLEVARRINKPTLILAPSIAIKNQWVDRFVELFLQTKRIPQWISTDIHNPEFLTVTTYQALHTAISGTAPIKEEDNEDEDPIETEEVRSVESDLAALIEKYKRISLGTIVVDEAHHIKNAWWTSLSLLKQHLPVTVVGLTATPPYDVSPAEWERYIELNGPVDSEISVPELISEGDLCPHQDYVYFSKPTVAETSDIHNARTLAEKWFLDLSRDKTLIEALSSHPVFKLPLQNIEWILDNVEFYSSILIFLNANMIAVPRVHFTIIGDRTFAFPSLTESWLEKVLQFYLYEDKEHFSVYHEHRLTTERELKKAGIIERKQVRFSLPKYIGSVLNTSTQKLDSIRTIIQHEYSAMGNDLRCVVLTDYIRSEYLSTKKNNDNSSEVMGALPIFETLRKGADKTFPMAVLTGSLVVLPVSIVASLRSYISKDKQSKLRTKPYPHDSTYCILQNTGSIKQNEVRLITRLFEDGGIKVLIGTKSLLGEGWDAPSMNTLILASFIGSYVSSNQMRGRAIRTSKKNAQKTSNIWHLVCLDPTVSDGGVDVQILRRRFQSFVGISLDEAGGIENGVRRLKIPDEGISAADAEKYNLQSMRISQQRVQLQQRWLLAIQNGTALIEQVKIPFAKKEDYQKVKRLYYSKTVKNVLIELGFGVLAFIEQVIAAFVRGSRSFHSAAELLFAVKLAGIAGLVIFGRRTLRTMYYYVKYRDIAKDAHAIANALLKTLIDAGNIKSDPNKITLHCDVNEYGAIYSHLEGGTTYEKSLFIASFQEILSRIENPRYLVIRKNLVMSLIMQKDYHAVPEIIARNKKFVELLKRHWKEKVGNCNMIYLRTVRGRRLLLQARMSALSSQFAPRSERVNIWK